MSKAFLNTVLRLKCVTVWRRLYIRAIGTPKPMAVEITGPRAPRKIINGNCKIPLTKTPIAK